MREYIYHLCNTFASIDAQTFQAAVIGNNEMGFPLSSAIRLSDGSDRCECYIVIVQFFCHAHTHLRHGNFGNNSMRNVSGVKCVDTEEMKTWLVAEKLASDQQMEHLKVIVTSIGQNCNIPPIAPSPSLVVQSKPFSCAAIYNRKLCVAKFMRV